MADMLRTINGVLHVLGAGDGEVARWDAESLERIATIVNARVAKMEAEKRRLFLVLHRDLDRDISHQPIPGMLCVSGLPSSSGHGPGAKPLNTPFSCSSRSTRPSLSVYWTFFPASPSG